MESGYSSPFGYIPASPSTYGNLAAPFASSAYNIRCAKIGKSEERKKDRNGEKRWEERRTNKTRGSSCGKRREGRNRILVCPRGQAIYTAYEIYIKVCESDGGGVEKGEKVGRDAVSRGHSQEGSSFKTKQAKKSARERGKKRD